MPLRNTPTEYGTVTKTFHWVMALLVIVLLGVGLYMEDMPLSATKLQVYNLHKSFGISVLALLVCRFCWHVINRRPAYVESMKPWEKHTATFVHGMLYVLIFAMPLTGWLMSSAAGRPVNIFGLFALPDLIGPDPAAAKILRQRHGQIGTLIMITVALHILAALKHHFIDKDHVLRRMLPALLVILFSSPALATDHQWLADPYKSSLTFKGKQMGAAFEGRFDIFKPVIIFDPDNLPASSVKVDIAVSTISTQSAERDEVIKGREWFDVANFPTARFESASFRKVESSTYEASGTLTIRDITMPVILPFTLKIVKDESDKGYMAIMDGALTLDRSKFKLGTGSWADTSVIANEVSVLVHLVARKAGH